MSPVTVPWSVPDEIVIVTIRLAGSPTVELLPRASRVRTTGWVPNGAPAVALPGCVVNARADAAAGVMVSICVAVVSPASVPEIVGVPTVLSR